MCAAKASNRRIGWCVCSHGCKHAFRMRIRDSMISIVVQALSSRQMMTLGGRAERNAARGPLPTWFFLTRNMYGKACWMSLLSHTMPRKEKFARARARVALMRRSCDDDVHWGAVPVVPVSRKGMLVSSRLMRRRVLPAALEAR